MENIILIFVCLIIGFLLQKIKDFPSNSHQVLNQFVIYISLPALALFYIPKIQISSDLLYSLAVPWVGFVLSFLFFSILGKKLGWSKKLIGCLVLTGGLGNTAFVGFPVIEALYGKQGLETAIIIDQPGTFVVLATLGVLVASYYSRGEASASMIVKKILLFPPFIGFVIAALFNVFQYDFVEELQSVFQKLGSTVTPIALIAVGLQLTFERKSKHWGFLTLGLAFKLFLTPAIFYFVYIIILGKTGLIMDVSIMEAAMAPMITASILASTYGLKPKLSSMMIGFGIPISFLTLAFWYWILQTF
ncbi:AEC family transporter [Flavobacterium tegetincola]|uniref:AEC family transporter n=1 Tax=Flavobacterium tegetincola TaxID=150172 RepID=UPI00041ED37B|nr:AEC family transporter [Flavobacterium tegetincola]